MSEQKVICGIDVGTTKIVAIIAEYSDDGNFSIIGIILKNSPTLEQWNHIKLPGNLFLARRENFSRNLRGFSFFLIILIIIMIGESIITTNTKKL